jgi:arylsulfatase A
LSRQLHLGGQDYLPRDQGFTKATIQYGRQFGSRLIVTTHYTFDPAEYLTQELTTYTIEFICNAGDLIFFVCFLHFAVHIPLQTRQPKIDKYAARSEQHLINPIYSAMVEHVDDSVGCVLCALKALNLESNTIVVFCSDNGGLTTPANSTNRFENGVTTNSPLRDEKGTLYEGGIRIPLILRVPNLSPVNLVCDTPITTADLFPTILGLTETSYRDSLSIDEMDITHSLTIQLSIRLPENLSSFNITTLTRPVPLFPGATNSLSIWTTVNYNSTT